ncbi:family 20 glycosylhydrolase [Chitinophaga nivalis]|uniref:beta-N-acetylhexosaminidase n=1 Tax=Chitinophaga nivalis TaxID=2991709 RepID=A0ABT3IJJ1_9BACT|nr:family 20 glycosylhydrolase [Chitinophaga nivalis]MCW3466200.1 family 20 glycosylhydrolase [Chitinophaga nivalis]MCW3484109.1 family 20 glycosylhydrolase [Chitinophaga nivalis]
MWKFFRLTGACCLLLHSAFAQSQRYPIIPYPQQLVPQAGTFDITAGTKLVLPADAAAFTPATAQLEQLFTRALGKPLAVATKADKGAIVLQQNPALAGAEDYTMEVTPQQLLITAKTGTGFFRAAQTLRQLMPPAIETATGKRLAKIAIPAMQLKDHPTYDWRGMHLDVSRHFFSITYLKKFIDLLALYKMNKLHLHLTDDQGWRIEIKKYPLLTTQGAWRTFNNQDSVCMKKAIDNPDMAIDEEHIIRKDGKTWYGGFYTQEQMKDIIAYAADRQIEIIPEIDMPGHMMAAIKAYPFLSCSEETGWGKDFSTPICPCNESTFTFAEDVFTEIAALFPSKYIHLGADEVEKSSWASSPACAAVMKANNLKTVEELQSYFVKRMEKFFNSKGKVLIGWDEILQGGISPTAVLMYWRAWVPDAPVQAARHGNKVIMTPGNPLYFDGTPDRNSIYNVYHFEPVPKGLTPEEATHIMGAQANIWTEYIASEKRADYMFMPRMTALAEVLWTHRPDYEGYLQRLQAHYKRLDNLGIHYRLPDLDGFTEDNVFVDKGSLQVKKPLTDMTIRYTTDGSIPDAKAKVLPGSLTITRPDTIRLAAFSPAGNRGDIYTLRYRQQNYLKATVVKDAFPGLQLDYYQGAFKSATAIKPMADSSLRVANVVIPEGMGKGGGAFGARIKGYIQVPATGIYSFYLTCDDGGILYIDEQEVVNNDGWHAPVQKSGQVALEKGWHPLQVAFVEGGGGYTLRLEYSINGGKLQPVPDEWLRSAR